MESLHARLGHRLRLLRVAKRLTQAELAQAVGTHTALISRLEKGDYRAINPNILARLVQVLDTTGDYLLGLSSEGGPVVPRTPPVPPWLTPSDDTGVVPIPVRA
jgi:transcriptional regulator with XRE-family HTH domain